MEKIVGKALRKEREARGVSLADIAAETRIGTRFLQALEDEEFDLFPGKFYIHYYIKNYLQACGADETAFYNTYRESLDEILQRNKELPPDQYMQKMSFTRFRRNRTLLLVVLVLAILALLAYLLLGPPRWLERMVPPRSAFSLAVPPISSHLLVSEEEYCLTWAPLRASLVLDAPCWLSLWRGSEKVAERTFRQGEAISLSGYRLTLVVANPPALRLQLNGSDVPYLRASPQAVKLVVEPGNLQEILRR
jgi:transcriptional regulator with XRE-family HTH domain